jgi:hypothetical protein
MTGDPKDARDALRRLADALAEDILNAPDEQVLADAAEIYGDTDKLAADMLRLFEQTASEQSKAKLVAARAAIAADRRRPARAARLDPAEARRGGFRDFFPPTPRPRASSRWPPARARPFRTMTCTACWKISRTLA